MKTTMDINIELIAECDDCGSPLTVKSVSGRKGEIAIKVSRCEKCLELFADEIGGYIKY